MNMAKSAKPTPAPVPAPAAPVAPPAPIAPPPVTAPPLVAAPAPSRPTRAVAKRNNDSSVSVLSRLEELSGFGLEEATGDDYAIPFLKLLQSMSPEVGKLANAEAGDFLHSATSELWSGADGVEFVPCYYKRRYIEWTPQDQGGGFVAIHTPDSPIMSKATRRGTKDVLPNGNEIQNTAQFIGLVRGENGFVPAAIEFRSTQLKKSRKWLTAIRSQTMEGASGPFVPPPFSFVYTLRATPEGNNKGRWFGFEIDAATRPTSAEPGLLDQAIALATSIKGGAVTVRDPENDAPTGKPGSGAGFSNTGDDGEDVL